MKSLQNIIALAILLIICTMCGYSMLDFKLSQKYSTICFSAVMIFCFVLNSVIALKYGLAVLRSNILFTTVIPYFILILFITKDKISQTVFNYWLWVSVYEIIANITVFIDSYIIRNYYCLTFLRFVFFCTYYILYNKYLKEKHKTLINSIEINWWLFSFIPILFTIVIRLMNYECDDFIRYPTLLAIYVLMVMVYILIFFTFITVQNSNEKLRIAETMKSQITLQKKQYEYHLQKEEDERIFRHDTRHRDLIMLEYLEQNNTSAAIELLNKELSGIKNISEVQYCENKLINAVISEYCEKAAGIEFKTHIQMPDLLACDEIEFCVMLSNLLENCIDAAVSYIQISIKQVNSQLLINIKNDYISDVKIENDKFITTKPHGSGLGLKSVETIVKNSGGFLRIDHSNNIFSVYISMKN